MSDWEGQLNELLMDDSDRLTAWEIEFIESLNTQRTQTGFEPSEKQLAALEKIGRRLWA